jgi:hypothetical protein
MVSHTWKGVELLRDLRYGAGGSARCKLNGDVKLDGNCNVNYARLKKQAAAALRSRSAGSQDDPRCSAIHKFNGSIKFNGCANGWRSEVRGYQGNCGALLAFFGFLELG